MTESRTLLSEYVEHGSEPAFRELVERYVGLVYATALRRTAGDAHLAEDIAQDVFIRLAQKAPRLSQGVTLGGWLYRTTGHVAATILRGERRRQEREKQAAAMNNSQDHTIENLALLAPLLDEAIDELRTADRLAILSRFFEQEEFGAVGKHLGITEETARKRVDRALCQLRLLLKRRGVALSVTALATFLSAEALRAIPAELAGRIAGAALVGAASAGGGGILTLIKAMTMTKIKTGAVCAIIVAGVAAPVFLQQNARTKLYQENQTLLRYARNLADLEMKTNRLSQALAEQANSRAFQEAQLHELARLRREIGPLRIASKELEQFKQEAFSKDLQEQNRTAQLRQLLRRHSDLAIPEFSFLSDQELADFARNADLETEKGIRDVFAGLRFRAINDLAPVMEAALKGFDDAHNGEVPSDVLELAPYFNPPIDSSVLQRYTVVQTNAIAAGWNGGWAVTQKQLVDASDHPWFISPVGYTPGVLAVSSQEQ